MKNLSQSNCLALLLAAIFSADASSAAPTGTSSRQQGAPKYLRGNDDRALADDNNVDPYCNLHVELGCTVLGDGMAAPEDCETYVLPQLTVEPCQQTPMTTTLLFNGGDCRAGADVNDGLLFTCEDGSSSSSPPVAEGDEAYIVVTDANNQGIVYHEDYVTVGTEYVVLDDSGGQQEPMQHGFVIEIFDSASRANRLQRVVYTNRLCSSELEMLKIFGASQIISYTNDEQGFVSPFAHYSYEVKLHISIALDDDGLADEAVLSRLNLLTDFAGYINLDGAVRDQTIAKNGAVTVSVPIEINLAESRSNAVLAQLSALHSEGPGGRCRNVSFHRFHTGGHMLA